MLFRSTERWKTEISDFGDRVTISIKPTDGSNADATLNISYPEVDRYDTPARLKFRAEVEAEKFSEQSVEGRAFAKPIQLTTGYGFLCHFTDPKLVGKAEKKGDFKTISTGLIHVSASILIEVVLEADGFASKPYNELLGAVEGMEYDPRPAARRQ